MISDIGNIIGINEVVDVGQKVVENNVEDVQSNDGKEVVEVGQKLVSKFLEGFEVGGIEKVFVKEVVEINEVD